MAYLQQIRRACAYALDDLAGPYLSLGPPGSTTTTVKLGELISLASPAPAASRFNGRWILHVPLDGMAKQQRVVRNGGWAPSTGVITIDYPWTPPAIYHTIELTSLFPGETPPFSAETSYRALINAALRKLDIGDRIAVSVGTNQTFTLPTYVTDESRLQKNEQGAFSIWEPAPFGTAPVDASWRRPRFVRDGAANLLILDVPFETATGSLSIDVLRPADTLIAPTGGGGVFSDSTTGLVNDVDMVSPQIEITEIVEVFLAEAYRALANRGDDASWNAKLAAQEPIARSQPHYHRGAETAPQQRREAA